MCLAKWPAVFEKSCTAGFIFSQRNYHMKLKHETLMFFIMAIYASLNVYWSMNNIARGDLLDAATAGGFAMFFALCAIAYGVKIPFV